MKFIQRLKIAWGLIFSGKYIDNLLSIIKELSFEIRSIENEFIKASSNFEESLKNINKSNKDKFLTRPSARLQKIILPEMPGIKKCLPDVHPSDIHPRDLFLPHTYNLYHARVMAESDFFDDDVIKYYAYELGKKLIDEGFLNIQEEKELGKTKYLISVSYYE